MTRRRPGVNKITGETESAEDEAGMREREQRRGGGVAVVITVAVAVVVARVDSEWWWCVVVVIRRGGRHRATLEKTGRGESCARAAGDGAHVIQWRGREAVSDVD